MNEVLYTVLQSPPFELDGHQLVGGHHGFAGTLPSRLQWSSARLLTLVGPGVLVLLVVGVQNLVRGNVHGDDDPLLELVLVQFMHVVLVAPVWHVVRLDHDVEVVLHERKCNFLLTYWVFKVT